MSELLAILFGRMTNPVIGGVRRKFHRLVVAVAVLAVGIASFIIGLTYFASSLWHALAPKLGTIGADLVLGFAYLVIALAAITVGLQRVQR